MLFFRLLGQAQLRSDDGTELSSVLAQPKRLALLTYLAIARPTGFHRRDTLLGLFWPDLDQERGRAALRQALYTLRQALGAGVVVTRGDGEIGLDFERFACDVVQFRQRLNADPEAALALYTGDLLTGFFISEAPEFERWLEEERWLLRREAASAAWRVAEVEHGSSGDAAAQWAMRAASLDPFNEEAVRRLMQLLAGRGQRTSALQVYQSFTRVLARELDTAPSEETVALAESLRRLPTPAPGNGNNFAHLDIEPIPRAQRGRRVLAAVGVVATVTLVGLYSILIARSPAETIAVGVIQGDPALRDMLATNLARIEGLDVISNTRITELSQGDTSAAAIVQAAQRAGAGRMIEGTVDRLASGGLRLTLQLVALEKGRVRTIGDVSESNALALIDAATAAIARDLKLKAPAVRFASVTTTSVRAYRLFEEGLRSYYREDRNGAERLWQAAVREDSMFAIAWWYLSRMHDLDASYTQRALQLAPRTTDRERLFITASFFASTDDPRTVAVAETLAIRYPHEPDGHFLLGYAKVWAGDPLGALPHLRNVVRLDTASLFDNVAIRCRACEAIREIGTAYAIADSAAAIERLAKDWLALQPQARGAWDLVIISNEMYGRYDKAIAAREHAVTIPPANHGDINITETYMRAGNFAAADDIILARTVSGDSASRANAYFKYTLSLRGQRRYEEALQAARAFRRLNPNRTPIYSAIPEGWALMAIGRYREAAALFDSIAYTAFTPLSVARNARAMINGFARSAEAYALAGDTTRLKQIADTMRALSRYTAFAPARNQHHFATGLLLRARGDHAAAARAFHAALVNPGNASTRIHYALAQELMILDRHRDAAMVLGSAIRSTVGGPGYALPHPELHARAARAWRLAGVTDSARAHEHWLRQQRLPEGRNVLASSAMRN